MDFTIKPLLPGMDFAGEVIGIDVASPINSSVYDQLRNALGKYAVLVFRNQNINDDQQIAFSEKFGSLEKSLGFDRGGGVTHPEISRIANVDDNNKIRSHGDEKSRYHRGNSLWHSDSSFKPIPANISILLSSPTP